MKRPSLLAQFSILSLVVLVVFGVALGFAVTRFFEAQELDRQTQVTAHLMQPAIAPFLSRDIIEHGARGKSYSDIEGAFGYLGGAGLVRIKIWNTEGMVVYSDDPTLVGRTYPVSDELKRAFQGEAEAHISDLGKAENVDERGFGELLEVYTPLVLANETHISGAFEGYYDIDELRNSLDETNRFLWIWLIIGFAALYLSLFAIVRGASQRLTRQSKENAALLTDTQRKAARLEMVNELARAINQESLDLDKVFQTALQGVNRIVPGGVAGLTLHDEDSDAPPRQVFLGSTRPSRGLLDGFRPDIQSRLLEVGNGSMALCPTTAGVSAADVRDLAARGVGSFLVVAISLGERTLGTLVVATEERGALNEDDADILKGVADQLAVAIENTRLIKETAETTALRETNRLKDEFVSMVSHELRTPLASIKGYSRTLLCDQGQEWDEATRREFLTIISDESDKLTDLVENLLEMSRIEAGRLPITPEPILLSRFCQSVLNRVGTHYPETKFECMLNDPLPVVEADPRRLEQVLTNLLQNAAKYSGSEVVRVVGSYPGGSEVVLSVQDTGKGIAPEHLPQLFDKFYRVDESVQGKGTGLGLAICKALVEAQGGRIWVESAPGKGTRFFFTLPALVMPGEGGSRPRQNGKALPAPAPAT